jgi:glycosyltransferase involved in cell wall biosynthesis
LGSFARACDLVIAPSASIATWLSEYCGFQDATVIPNGIDVERFAHPASPVARAELGFSDSDIVFCYAGRLGPEKNTPLLVREFARVCSEQPHARLLVIGDGPARGDAERALADLGCGERARFLGMQPYDRLPDLEAAADVFVTASVSEVHPLVVLEAMAAGLPVTAIHSPGISDTVEDGVSGLLAADESPGGLSAKMRAVASDASLRARLARAARLRAYDYSLDNTADVVLAHFTTLPKRAGRTP